MTAPWVLADKKCGKGDSEGHGEPAERETTLDPPPVELLLRPLKMGKKLKVVYIDYRERVGTSTMRPLQSAWWTLRRIVSVRFA